MFVGNDRFQMGAMDATRWPQPEGRRVLDEIQQNDKTNHPLCRDCWARGLCSGCIGGDYIENGDLALKPRCALTKGMAAEAIVRLAELGPGQTARPLWPRASPECAFVRCKGGKQPLKPVYLNK